MSLEVNSKSYVSIPFAIGTERKRSAQNQKKIIFIVGPTGVGKSRIAVELARKLDGEIISCDSMQIYKGMDLITSKLALALRRKVKHHLIDDISPSREYNVFEFRKSALKAVKDIIKRKRVPLLVGGTGLYMSILIDGIFEFVGEDKRIRKRLYEQVSARGSSYLHKRLQKVDPEAAAKIHPHDTKRIIRGLEVFESTGRPISQWQKQRKGLGAEYDVKIFCLNRKRDELYKLIDRRVDEMFAAGLEREVRKLLKLRLSKTAVYAIGLKELKRYLEGDLGLEEAKRQIKMNTRHYAKRKLTWFRKDKRIRWIKVSPGETASSVTQRIRYALSRC